MAREIATHQEIQKWVEEHHGFQPTSAWIAHCKELQGLLLTASNGQVEERDEQCPEDKRAAIFQALRHFEIIS
jgi:hypothetical protein